MTAKTDARGAVADAHRREWAFVLAATVRVARDLDLAEECVQEAYAAALSAWERGGIPGNPAAWLTTTAKRRAMDAIRRERTFRSRLPLLVEPEEAVDELAPATLGEHGEGEAVDLEDVVPDERLRLIFTCCHPALAQEAQLALTLRLVCGLPTPDVARALLVSEQTMAARITRAKKKISAARIPYRMPRPAELPDRLTSVLGVLHLLFTAGHTAPSGPVLMRTDLADRALHLARTLRALMPDEPEVGGLLALLLVTDARRATRTGADGRLLRLQEQDRSRWDRTALAEAHELIVAGLRGGRAGHYLLQAAIACVYARAPTYQETDWPQIVALYDRLLSLWPSPVVALNRTRTAVDGPRTGRRAGAGRGPGAGQPTLRVPVPTGCQSRPAAAPRPEGRGVGRVPAGTGADPQRGRAGVPHRAPHRTRNPTRVRNPVNAGAGIRYDPTPVTKPRRGSFHRRTGPRWGRSPPSMRLRRGTASHMCTLM